MLLEIVTAILINWRINVDFLYFHITSDISLQAYIYIWNTGIFETQYNQLILNTIISCTNSYHMEANCTLVCNSRPHISQCEFGKCWKLVKIMQWLHVDSHVLCLSWFVCYIELKNLHYDNGWATTSKINIETFLRWLWPTILTTRLA